MARIADLLARIFAAVSAPPPPAPRPNILFTGSSGPITASPYLLTLESHDVQRVDFFKGTVQIGQRLAPPFTFPAELTTADNGEVQFRAVVVHTNGDQREVGFTATVDIGAPVIAPPVPLLTASALIFTTNGLLELAASAIPDAHGPVTLLLERDNGVAIPIVNGVATETITAASNGTYVYKLTATRGNKSGVTSVRVVVAIPAALPTLDLDKIRAVAGDTLTATLGDLQAGDRLDWGDGTTVAGAASLSHSYKTAGPYTVRVLRGSVAGASAAVTITAAIISNGLTSDGNAFTWQPNAYSGPGLATAYRTYSLRKTDAIPRVLLADTAMPTPVVDDTVMDGQTVWYKTFAVVGGVEVLADSATGTQPARPGWAMGQLIITAPGTYTVSIKNTDRTRAAVVIQPGVTGVVLKGRLASAGNGVNLGAGAGVDMRDMRAWGLHPGVANAGHGRLIDGAQAASIVLEYTYSENWLFTIYNNGLGGGNSRTSTLQLFRVRYNLMRNCEGRKTTATDYVQTGDSRWGSIAHFVQINGCADIASFELARNQFIQEPFHGFVEDPVNIYNSSCIASNWGEIHHNLMYGGYAPNTIQSRGYAGCAIIFDGNSANTRYWRCNDNVSSGVTNCGPACPHGQDIEILRNDVVCSGYLEDGTMNWSVNLGIYAYDYVASDPIKRVKVRENTSRVYRPAGSSQNPEGPGRVGNYVLSKDGVDGCDMPYSANGEPPYASLTAAQRMEAERIAYRDHGASMAAGGYTLGPSA